MVRFYIPVMALFFLASEVTMEQFTFIFAIVALVTFVLEIPAGVFTDIIGKKNTLHIVYTLCIIDILIRSFMNGFWPMLTTMIIVGVAISLVSGTKQAMLYDTLVVLNREKEHKKISARIFMLMNFTMAVAFIIGGVLFSIDSKLPAIATIPFILIAFVMAFFLKEPIPPKGNLTLGHAWQHLVEGLRYFWKHDYVKFLGLYSLPVAAAIMMTLNLSSAYLEVILIPASLIGVIAFIGSSLTALSARGADKLETRIGEAKALMLIPVVLLCGLGLISLMAEYIGAVFYLLIGIASGFFNVIINHYMNKHIESSHRATMLSIRNMFGNAAVFMVFPFLGLSINKVGWQISFWWLGGLIFVYFVGLYFYSKKLRIGQIS